MDTMLWDTLADDARVYVHETMGVLWESMEGPLRMTLEKEWNISPPSTKQELRQYYRQAHGYLADLVHWHTHAPSRQEWCEEMVQHAEECESFIDVGCGIGTDGLSMKWNYPDMEVVMIDYPNLARCFAQWRAERYELEMVFMPPEIVGCANGIPDTYDMTCIIDVVEHIGDGYEEWLEGWAARTRKFVAITAPFNDGGDLAHPQHFAQTGRSAREVLECCGFRPMRESQVMFERIEEV